jgi:hypothetical protein
LRSFALDGTDHASHKEQASMIRRYIIWRNNHAYTAAGPEPVVRRSRGKPRHRAGRRLAITSVTAIVPTSAANPLAPISCGPRCANAPRAGSMSSRP